MNWTNLEIAGRHVYATLLGCDIVRVEFHGPPDPCCLEAATVAARLAQLEVGGHRAMEISVGAAGFGFDRIGAADQLASVRHDLTVRIEQRDLSVHIEPRDAERS